MAGFSLFFSFSFSFSQACLVLAAARVLPARIRIAGRTLHSNDSLMKGMGRCTHPSANVCRRAERFVCEACSLHGCARATATRLPRGLACVSVAVQHLTARPCEEHVAAVRGSSTGSTAGSSAGASSSSCCNCTYRLDCSQLVYSGLPVAAQRWRSRCMQNSSVL